MGLLFVLATMLMYGIAAVVGLESTRAMLLLSRALQLVELPFFGFLLDCKVTVPSAPSSVCSTSGPGAPVPLHRRSAPTASAAAPAGGCC